MRFLLITCLPALTTRLLSYTLVFILRASNPFSTSTIPQPTWKIFRSATLITSAAWLGAATPPLGRCQSAPNRFGGCPSVPSRTFLIWIFSWDRIWRISPSFSGTRGGWSLYRFWDWIIVQFSPSLKTTPTPFLRYDISRSCPRIGSGSRMWT